MKSYEELVEGIRRIYENADARSILDHIALEIHITGEVSGICYLEVAAREITVEPYDYHDHDGIATLDCHVLEEIVDGKYTAYDAIKQNRLLLTGNISKISELGKIIFEDEKDDIKIDKTDRFYRFKTMLKIRSLKD